MDSDEDEKPKAGGRGMGKSSSARFADDADDFLSGLDDLDPDKVKPASRDTTPTTGRRAAATAPSSTAVTPSSKPVREDHLNHAHGLHEWPQYHLVDY